MRSFPWIAEQPLQIDLFFAVRTRLLLSNDTPTAYAKLMENMITRQFEGALDNTRFIFTN